tara:strand:- start:1942 stop:2595 length:654 start_codon:yes stop_codon:yes gene_type:complete
VDTETVRSLLIPLHAVLGIVALISGMTALLLRKERGRHTQFGIAFFGFLMAAIAASLPVIVLSQNIFLGGLGAVALYLAIMGYRIGRLRPPQAAPTNTDHACVWLGLMAFSLFALLGLWVVQTGQLLGAVMVFLGGLGVKSAWKHRRFFADPEGDLESWMEHHGGTLGGAIVASSTAFSAATLTNLLPDFPEWILWVAPVVLLAPVVGKQVKRGTSA